MAYDIDNQGAGNYTYDNIGNLLSDASEQIQEIKWNVYGKVTEVIRTSGSARPNLKFSYDAAGRRITKASTVSGNTTYTYYVLDAQGNTLATYSRTFNAPSDITLDDNLLYGSRRIGLHKRDKKLSFVAQTPTPVQVTRGQKRYELSNHLGNVHVVVSDRKKTECVSNVFSAYEPEIINTYDYYPFGMLMEERKGQKPECTTSSSATTKTPYNFTFTWLTHEFVGSSNVTTGTTGSALTVEYNFKSVSGWLAYRTGHSLVKGVTYTLSYQLQGAAPSGYTTTIGKVVQVRLKWGTTVVASANMTLTASMQSGSFNYTADYTGDYTIELAYVDVAVSKAQFLADNIKITYNSQLTTVNCGTAEKYLYGFNGKEKIDEQYGIEGTAYDFGARLYDSRLGRWMAVDPLAGKYAGWSPYNFVMNSPLVFIDPDGRDIFPIALIIQGVKLNQIVSQSKIYSGLLEYFDNNSRFDINFDSYEKGELNGDGGTSVKVVLKDGSEISLDRIDPSTFDPSEIVKYKTTVGINKTLDAGSALMVISHEVSLHVPEVVKMIKQFEGGGTFENFVQEYKTWLAANESKAQENSDAHQTVAENTGTYKDLSADIINILSRKENNYNDKTKKGGDRLNKWFKVSEYNKKFNEAPSYTVDQTTKQVTFMPVSVLSRFINALARATALYGGDQESAYKAYNKKGVDADYEVYEKAKKDGYVEK